VIGADDAYDKCDDIIKIARKQRKMRRDSMKENKAVIEALVI